MAVSMSKNKKIISANNKVTSTAASKRPRGKKTIPTVWDHHDTMIVNVKMWVQSTIDNLGRDLDKYAPELTGKPKLTSALNKAAALNDQLWQQIRIVHEIAEQTGEKS